MARPFHAKSVLGRSGISELRDVYKRQTFSYTRLNVEGHSRKRNLLEYDLWSPYIDAPRALTYARYAALEGVLPMPIVLGNFPENTPSNQMCIRDRHPSTFFRKYFVLLLTFHPIFGIIDNVLS